MNSHLVSVPEIAVILGVSQQRARRIIATYDDFPVPTAVLAIGRIWLRTDVEQWARSHPRKPGRRPANPPPNTH